MMILLVTTFSLLAACFGRHVVNTVGGTLQARRQGQSELRGWQPHYLLSDFPGDIRGAVSATYHELRQFFQKSAGYKPGPGQSFRSLLVWPYHFVCLLSSATLLLLSPLFLAVLFSLILVFWLAWVCAFVVRLAHARTVIWLRLRLSPLFYQCANPGCFAENRETIAACPACGFRFPAAVPGIHGIHSARCACGYRMRLRPAGLTLCCHSCSQPLALPGSPHATYRILVSAGPEILDTCLNLLRSRDVKSGSFPGACVEGVLLQERVSRRSQVTVLVEFEYSYRESAISPLVTDEHIIIVGSFTDNLPNFTWDRPKGAGTLIETAINRYRYAVDKPLLRICVAGPGHDPRHLIPTGTTGMAAAPHQGLLRCLHHSFERIQIENQALLYDLSGEGSEVLPLKRLLGNAAAAIRKSVWKDRLAKPVHLLTACLPGALLLLVLSASIGMVPAPVRQEIGRFVQLRADWASRLIHSHAGAAPGRSAEEYPLVLKVVAKPGLKLRNSPAIGADNVVGLLPVNSVIRAFENRRQNDFLWYRIIGDGVMRGWVCAGPGHRYLKRIESKAVQNPLSEEVR